MTAKKNDKAETPQTPKLDYQVAVRLRRKLERSLDEHISSVYGLEGMLYDMWGDYRKAEQVIKNVELAAAVDSNMGSFEARLLAAQSHAGNRYHNGAAVFKYCLEFKNEGEHETRVDTVVIGGKSTTDILYQLTHHLGVEIDDWYQEKYSAKYGDGEQLPF